MSGKITNARIQRVLIERYPARRVYHGTYLSVARELGVPRARVADVAARLKFGIVDAHELLNERMEPGVIYTRQALNALIPEAPTATLATAIRKQAQEGLIEVGGGARNWRCWRNSKAGAQ